MDATTGQSSQSMRLYGALLARFDALDDLQRTDLVELVVSWCDATPEDRNRLLDLARRFTAR